jgi:chromosome segregation ATPase
MRQVARQITGLAKRRARFALLVALALASPVAARAQSETDRLREALRNATAQARALEDQRAALQAKLTAAEQEGDRLRKQNEAYRVQVKEAEQAYSEAVKEFNARLAERDETLEKWKSAYSEAADVARTKEADRAKLDGEVTSLKAGNKSCTAKNAQLVKTGNDILTQFDAMNPLQKLVVHEPLVRIKRVEHQNAVQDYRDKILDQQVKP